MFIEAVHTALVVPVILQRHGVGFGPEAHGQDHGAGALGLGDAGGREAAEVGGVAGVVGGGGGVGAFDEVGFCCWVL